MSFVGLDLSKNISLFTIPAAFAVGMSAHSYAIVNAGKLYDNSNPRAFKDSISSTQTIDNETKRRLSHAKAAGENMFETIGLYAAAVVAANVSGVPPAELNFWSLTFVGSRVGYTLWYIILGGNKTVAPVRSFIWLASIVSIMTLFVKAGFRLQG